MDIIGEHGVRRSYSLANAPEPTGTLELHIREIPGGAMSDYWFCHAKENDLLRLNGPLGTFFLRNFDKQHIVFLATGTGIAPIKAMLESLRTTPWDTMPKSVSIYWGGRTLQDLYMNRFDSEASCRYVPVLSRGAAGWSGATGYVQDILMKDGLNHDETIIFACGSDAMIHSARDLLIESGLPERQFLSDAFVPSAPG